MPSDLDGDLALALSLARQAADLVRDRAGRIDRLTKRGEEEAVTEADRAAQALIIAGLRARHPDDGIIGEETSTGADGITNIAPKAGRRVWVIDPIDGTNNFITGFGAYAVCIGLLEDGLPVAGVVHDVARTEVYAARRGGGLTLNGRPARCATSPLGDGSLLMLTSNLVRPDGRLPPVVTHWLQDTPYKIRILGSAALEAAAVAAGLAHGALTLHGKLWDIAAPAALLAESGASLTDPTGRPIFPFDTVGYAGTKVPFLAAAPTAQATLLEDLRKHWDG